MADLQKHTIYKNTDFEILTEKGFKDFNGLIVGVNDNKLKITCTDGTTLSCTPGHKLVKNIGQKQYSLASSLSAEDTIQDKIIDSIYSYQSTDQVYEILDVHNEHTYYTNNILCHQCLVLDELSFIEPDSMLEDFWRSVYPTISRAKTSKILIASTPNGVGNLFHRLVSDSQKGINDFKLEKVRWDELPGRDEKWKQQQIAELGSLDSFLQEYENHFLDSGDSSIDEATYEKLKLGCYEAPIILEDGKYRIWKEPDPDHLYVAGVDVSDGVGQDYSVINIFDITDIREIEQVAVWACNTTVPAEFTNKTYEVLQNWGKPFALIERNNQGAQVVDRLGYELGYENIISYGSKQARRTKHQLGMVSHTNTKYTAVTNMRYFVNEMTAVVLRDIRTLKEFKTFVRMPNGTWKAEADSRDDRVMSTAWALMVLEKSITEKYFEIAKVDDFGKPLKLEKMDFGVKYFENPTSIYTNQTTGETSTFANPVMFGWGSAQEDEIQDLELAGWRSLANS